MCGASIMAGRCSNGASKGQWTVPESRALILGAARRQLSRTLVAPPGQAIVRRSTPELLEGFATSEGLKANACPSYQPKPCLRRQNREIVGITTTRLWGRGRDSVTRIADNLRLIVVCLRIQQ